MKIDWSLKIKNIDGPAMVRGGEELSLKTVAIEALLANLRGDDSLSGEQKLGIWKAAKKIDAGGDITIEEISIVKDRVGRMFTAAVVGPVYEIIEGSNE